MLRLLLLPALVLWAAPALALDAVAYAYVEGGIPVLHFFSPACEPPPPGEPPDIAECAYLEISCGSDGATAIILRDVGSRDVSRWFAEPGGPASILTIGKTSFPLSLQRLGANFLSGGWDVLFAGPYRAFSAIPPANLAADSWGLKKLDATLDFPVSGANRVPVETFVKACGEP